ncbi:hypothetical protein V2W30_17590 [Streptomyces sp. Q6]|uniref:Uncharacterized protein n=1 Tax=Streptomyces citrinus TaxID=3118173 RepID=A0ACD5APB4_9ACTN
MLPADGSEPLLPGTFGDQAGPAAAAPWGQPWGPESQQAQAAGPMPTYEWGQPAGQQQPPQQQQQQYQLQQPQAQALPPERSAPLPPAYEGTYGNGYGAGYDGDATQYIAPVAASPLPPEAPAADATQFLGRTVDRPLPGPLPDAVPGGAGVSDSDATQYIPPVPAQPQAAAPYGVRPGGPEDRQPPAEFDALFRTEPEGGAAATQQMPRFDPHSQGPQGPQGPMVPPVQQHAYEPEPPSRGKARTGSKLPLIAAIGVGILIVGIGAGALLGGGGDDEKNTDASKNVSATAPASEQASPSADPVKAQAVELDKLLADSNNSRDSVVRAVASIGSCKDLPASSTNLRNAAKQRSDLVTRLSGLSVDKLPDHAALTDALTKAWQASASADNHYAAWGDQVAGKKGCHKGHARPTPERRAGDAASGTASQQKARAAKLWNQIATTYGLTQRSAVQL